MNSSLPGFRWSLRLAPTWIVILLLCVSPPAQASEEKQSTKAAASQPATGAAKANPAKSKSKPAKPAREPGAVVTGSLIPQKASRLGTIPAISSPVHVISSEQLARTGSATVAGALHRSGYR